MPYYPVFEELVRSGSNPLLEVRRSFRSVLSSIALFLLCLLIVYLLNLFFHDFRFSQNISVLKHFSMRYLAIIPALVLLEIIRKHHDDLYKFGLHTITHYEGRLSLTSSLPSLKYVDILRTAVKQDLIGRVFNFGHVELDSAGDHKVEMVLRGVAAPHELLTLIEQLRLFNSEESTEQSQDGQAFTPASNI